MLQAVVNVCFNCSSCSCNVSQRANIFKIFAPSLSSSDTPSNSSADARCELRLLKPLRQWRRGNYTNRIPSQFKRAPSD
jgi:hypothetical protein